MVFCAVYYFPFLKSCVCILFVQVSPVADTDDTNQDHVICVFTTDFTDEQQVFQVSLLLLLLLLF